MTTRKQLEAEAAELYPTPDDPYTPHEAFQERAAYIRAKTITAEQLEAAAEAACEVSWRAMYGTDFWQDTRPDHETFVQEELDVLLPALDVLNITVEGDDDVSEAQR